jgi:hypothetical protein
LDEIALFVRRLAPGQALDLPAWCCLTGHQLVEQRDDRFPARRTG